MKIFFCETSNDGTVGGSHECMYNLIRHMDKKKMAFTVGFYEDNVYVRRFRELGVGVKVLPIHNPRRKGNVLFRKALNWYDLEYKAGKYLEDYFRREGFDLVVMNNSIFTSVLFVRACRKLGIPVVVYERGIGHFDSKHIKASARVGASITVSEAVRGFLLDFGYRAEVIETIYDGLDLSRAVSRREAPDIKKGLGIPPDGKVIGIVGNVRPWKGQRYFVEAFLQLAKKYDGIYGLVIGGCGEENRRYLEGLKETTRQSGLERRLLFLGYRDDVSELLSAFDVFVHASTKAEPFGMVILEAMAAKVPVVATNLGGPVEILNGGDCGFLVPPGDGGAIAGACAEYLEDSALRRDTVEKAYKRLLENYLISRTVEKTERLFESVCNGAFVQEPAQF